MTKEKRKKEKKTLNRIQLGASSFNTNFNSDGEHVKKPHLPRRHVSRR